ncbi:MAG TPA: hypothetical protein VHV51_20255, partial [Polyangiaceae bacterium]|nr:hypothetical protein [Polyangiaceae bacterium]
MIFGERRLTRKERGGHEAIVAVERAAVRCGAGIDCDISRRIAVEAVTVHRNVRTLASEIRKLGLELAVPLGERQLI